MRAVPGSDIRTDHGLKYWWSVRQAGKLTELFLHSDYLLSQLLVWESVLINQCVILLNSRYIGEFARVHTESAVDDVWQWRLQRLLFRGRSTLSRPFALSLYFGIYCCCVNERTEIDLTDISGELFLVLNEWFLESVLDRETSELILINIRIDYVSRRSLWSLKAWLLNLGFVVWSKHELIRPLVVVIQVEGLFLRLQVLQRSTDWRK